MLDQARTIVAVCGKGGVGKTALCALLARALRDAERGPMLLIDADPVCGLVSALGLPLPKTLASVRTELIGAARGSDDATRQRIADNLDHLVMEALVETDAFSLLAMGNTSDKGCFCSVNALLRDAIDVVVTPFRTVVIDGEAGIEQVNRQVTRRVDRVVVVTDGSRRSVETLSLIAGRTDPARLAVVAVRGPAPAESELPDHVRVLGTVPEDANVRSFDQQGRSLWDLPDDTPAMTACRQLVAALG
ncbi:MAG: nucleotide-binding protein, partial [Coriobacteriia bacterium]